MLPAEENQERGWLTREEAETNWDYGERPETRDVKELLDNGLILVDKPSGPTSHDVSIWTKKILERSKTGHSGTLDPHVTGVLPIGLNRGTKVLQALTLAGKEYVCSMKLEDEVSLADAKEVGQELIGTLKQVPPEKSAVKREEREREVYALDVLEVDGDQVLFRVECEKGFYVRVFCQQYGEALGTEGVMEDLRRTKVGVFHESQLHTLQEVKDEYEFWKEDNDNRLDKMVMPVEAGVRHLKKVLVKDTAVAALCHGAELGTQGVSKLQEDIKPGEMVALLTLKGELIALGTAKMGSEDVVEGAGTAFGLKRVFMGKDVYPRGWQ